MARRLVGGAGRAGIIVPTGIATDDTCKDFFGGLNEKRGLVSLYDFENREVLFPDVDSRMKFSLLTMSAKQVERAEFAFFSSRAEHLRDAERRFTLTAEDLALLNPNTRTCPVFRTRADAELTKEIYQRVPVLVNERTGENRWGVKFLAMFHMANDSSLFRTAPGDGLLPLYEGKMVQAYDHRAASVITVLDNLKRPGQPVELTFQDHQDPRYLPKPQYHVRRSDVDSRLVGVWTRHWLIAYKSVTSPTNERTMIAAVLPFCGIAHSMNVVFPFEQNAILGACFLSNLNALVLDFAAKQKVGGVNLSYFLVRQFPFIGPMAYTREDTRFIAPRVLELVYTAWDIKPFADDLWREADVAAGSSRHDRNGGVKPPLHELIRQQWQENKAATGGHEWNPPQWVEIAKDGIPLPPFKWDEDRRAQLRAELDAYYAHLYGLTRDELRYILDPKDVYGPDFPSETFRVLKEKEEKLYGEYRTRRLVLAAYDELTKEGAPLGG